MIKSQPNYGVMCISSYFVIGEILKEFNLCPEIEQFHLSKLVAIFLPSSDVYYFLTGREIAPNKGANAT